MRGPSEYYAVFGMVSAYVQDDLECFKEFIESRGVETGAWRDTVEQSRT